MDKCVFCGGQVSRQQVTFLYDDDDNYFFVEHVPAEVCTKCGERTYSPEVAEKLTRLAKKGHPTRTIQVPVFNFGETSM